MQKMSNPSWASALGLVIAPWGAAPLPVRAIPFTPAVEYASFDGLILRPGTVEIGRASCRVRVTVDALASWAQSNGITILPNPDVEVGLWESVGSLLV